MDLRLTGLASGFDWETLVNRLIELERVPQQRLRNEQSLLQQRNTAYGSLVTQLNVLRNRVEALKDPSLYASRTARVTDATVLTAAATAAALPGRYTVTISQLATASSLAGTANVGAPISATDDVSELVLSQAGFAVPVTAGTFTVNGRQVTIELTDTLQQVFDKISAATDGVVTASYSSATDQITLHSSSGPIVLGSAADTSNFLQAARLYNNGTDTVTSASALGAVRLSARLDQARFAVPISDGGSGTGEFKINGVSITYNASTDTVADVLARINSSAAGVAATYDAVQDRFLLVNKATGDLGIGLEDVTGNFLAATGLLEGTLERGRNLLYSINGGPQLVSASNTITAESSSLPGLTITALKEGTTTVEVSTDTAKIRTAITDFISEYNRLQSMIDTETAVSTDAQGKVTAGVLAGDWQTHSLATELRRLVNGVVTGLDGPIRQLDHLGIVSNGNDNTLQLSDETKLDAALASHLDEVCALFSDSSNGLAVQLSAFLDAAAGEDGSLIRHQTSLQKQISDIDTQIAELERVVQANQQRLIDSFIAMEQARAQINQQILFLQQRLGLQSYNA